MKPRFSLKWLFVSIAFVALLCGWISDHLRLHKKLETEQANVRGLTNKVRSDRKNMLELMGVAGSFGYFGIEHPDHFIPGHNPGEILLLMDGEVDEMTAWYLSNSGFPNIYFKDVRLLSEARQILAQEYDDTFDGTYHLCWRRQPYGASAK